MKYIDPSKPMTDEEINLIRELIESDPKAEFIEKRRTHNKYNPEKAFKLTCNLIKDENSTPDHPKFYVISNEPMHLLGKGSFSTARAIIKSIEFPKEGPAIISDVTDLAVRIKNRKEAQLKREQSGSEPYSHGEAIEDYEKAKDFIHFHPQSPIEVKKKLFKKDLSQESLLASALESPSLARPASPVTQGLFSKSYMIVNRFPGKELQEACKDLQTITTIKLKNRPEIKEVRYQLEDLVNLTVAILDAYRKQFKDQVHRDLKPENILVDVSKKPFVVNIIDPDSAKKIGEKDDLMGTPGYLAPELDTSTGNKMPTVQRARDAFSLGMILIGVWNPLLSPTKFFEELANQELDGEDIINQCWTLVYNDENLYEGEGFYNPKAYYNNSPAYNFYACVDTQLNDTEKMDLDNIFREMTQVDPIKRDTAIDKAHDFFTQFQHKLEERMTADSSSPKPLKH